jgi:voltage-gated potassium channel Kch
MAFRVLILFAHPALQKSTVNRRLISAVRGLRGVTINDLYEEYPDFDIEVGREQELLLNHDIIIFQHPFYWYSSPATLKQWEDLVLEYGFAYGKGGTRLQEKLFSAGASIEIPLIRSHPYLICGLVFGLVLVKFLLLLLIGKITKLEESQNFIFAFSLAQGGEFAFVFYGDASRLELLRAAGADRAKLFILAIDDEEKSLLIVDTIHKHFPNLKILARAKGHDHAYELLGHGVEHVFRETLGSSLDLSISALRMLGMRAYEATRAAKLFREYDEKTVRELAKFVGDESRYISEARAKIRTLDEIFQAERVQIRHSGTG